MCDVNREEEREPPNRTVNLCEVNREGKRESATASAQPTLFVASRPHLHFPLSLSLSHSPFISSGYLAEIADRIRSVFFQQRARSVGNKKCSDFLCDSLDQREIFTVNYQLENILKNIEIFCAVILDYYIHANELK